MSRWIGPEYDHIDAVLAAAEAWRDRCFLADDSLFGDENLWTFDNIRELGRRIFNEPITGKGSFVENLEKQLEAASPQLIRLAAEAVWFLHLFPASTSMKQETKRNQVKQIWKWSGSDLENSSYLSDRTLKGVAHPGRQYFQNRGQNFEFLIQAMERWKTESQSRQAALMNEDAPWSLARWFDAIKNSDRRPMRSVILYLLFPDYMERISSLQDRKRIVETFKNQIPLKFQLNDEFSSVDVDRALYELRKGLEKELRTEKIDFFFPPIKEMWRPDRTPGLAPAVSHGKSSLNSILYGPPGTGKTYATARRCVEICDGKAGEDIRGRYDALVEEGRVEFVTFHQSYGYEEFVEGLHPETGKGAGFRLVAKDGVLKRIAERARESEGRLPHVLVIDEINRANVSKVLGELVTLLEEDKREGTENETAVTLPYSGESFTLPANLHVLGTMNTADRSIALLDTALRRRFEFDEVSPQPELLETVDGIDLPAVLRAINARLEYLIDRDHLIGHAWFMGAETKAGVDHIMRRKIVPLIAEYFHDDWNKVHAVLGGSGDFVRRERLPSPPGLDEDTGEERHRWTVQDSFKDGAYDRLVSGKAPDAETEAE